MATRLKKKATPRSSLPMLSLRSLGGPAVGIVLTNEAGQSVYIEPVWDQVRGDTFEDGGDWSFRCYWGVDPLCIDDRAESVMMTLVDAG